MPGSDTPSPESQPLRSFSGSTQQSFVDSPVPTMSAPMIAPLVIDNLAKDFNLEPRQRANLHAFVKVFGSSCLSWPVGSLNSLLDWLCGWDHVEEWPFDSGVYACRAVLWGRRKAPTSSRTRFYRLEGTFQWPQDSTRRPVRAYKRTNGKLSHFVVSGRRLTIFQQANIRRVANDLVYQANRTNFVTVNIDLMVSRVVLCSICPDRCSRCRNMRVIIRLPWGYPMSLTTLLESEFCRRTSRRHALVSVTHLDKMYVKIFTYIAVVDCVADPRQYHWKWYNVSHKIHLPYSQQVSTRSIRR